MTGGLVLARPFALALHSFVAPAGDDIVLKITPPDDDESNEEAEALMLWDGDGAVRVLRRDRDRRALLLERACPGEDASTIAEDEAAHVAVSTGTKLWRRRHPAISEHSRSDPALGLAASTGRPLCEIAVDLYAALDRRDDLLVHGDLHHHNLLRHGERWVAIDPKPMLGEPEYDVPRSSGTPSAA